MLRLNIEPLDLLLFRDGRPFSRGESATSLLFPSPLTFQGAVRAKLWKFKENIPSEWLEPEEPPFLFYGPFFEKSGDLLFPIYPAVLNIFTYEDKFVKAENCNLPSKKWSLPLEKGFEKTERVFLPIDEFKAFLLNKGPDKGKFVQERELWEVEERVSIRIDPERYSVSEEDALFFVGFLRLKSGVRFSLFIEVEGDEQEEELRELLEKEPKALQLGGERRPVRYDVVEENLEDLFKDIKKEIEERVKQLGMMRVVFLTPSIPKKEFVPQSINPALIASSFLPKPLRLGGWDYDKKQPRPMRYALAPGTIFWLENSDVEDFWFRFHTDYFPKLGLGLTIVGVGDKDAS